MTLQWVAEHFEKTQIAFLVLVVAMAWLGLRSRSQNSNFKVRVADRSDLNRLKEKGGPDLASAKLTSAQKKTVTPPLSLPGIRLHGAPHEILGIAPDANEEEIMKAYKDAIKLYHPDRVQGQGQSQLKFYQEAASQLNQAKEAMMNQLKQKI